MRISAALLFIFSLVICANALAQQDTFRVKTAKVVTVLPGHDIVYLNEDNTITIRYKGRHALGKVQFLGGTIDKKTDSTYILKATSGVEGVLTVYEKLANGSQRIALNKKYRLFTRPLPEVLLDGVKCDSVVDKFTVIASGRLQLRSKHSNEKFVVTSFNLVIPGEKIDTLAAEGNQMSQDMKIAVDNMPKGRGGMLIFRDIKCRNTKGEEKTLPVFRVYLSEVPRTKAGM